MSLHTNQYLKTNKVKFTYPHNSEKKKKNGGKTSAPLIKQKETAVSVETVVIG